MKPVLSFVSLMAVGLIAASAVAMIGAGLMRIPVAKAHLCSTIDLFRSVLLLA